MSLKSVLVPVRPLEGPDNLLRLAVDFAYEQQADLIGVGARVSIFVEDPGIGYLDPSTVQSIIDEEAAELAAARARFNTLARPLGDRAHWRERRMFPNDALNEAAGRADIILAEMGRGPSGYDIDLPALVCEAGLPVLAVPSEWERLRFNSILVAWRNTREARRALACALPLLRQAKEVHLLEVAPERESERAWDSLKDAGARLEKHGVASFSRTRPCGRTVAETVQNVALDVSADLIVLGAYGHSRAREWVLGGVTRDLLDSQSIPLLLCH